MLSSPSPPSTRIYRYIHPLVIVLSYALLLNTTKINDFRCHDMYPPVPCNVQDMILIPEVSLAPLLTYMPAMK